MKELSFKIETKAFKSNARITNITEYSFMNVYIRKNAFVLRFSKKGETKFPQLKYFKALGKNVICKV